jgi:hypothetical protein
MKENPKLHITEGDKYSYTQTRAEATNITEEQLRLQMEKEFSARQGVVDFLAGAKPGEPRIEYFNLTDHRNTDWYVSEGTSTATGNPAYMAIVENREYLKLHKEFEGIWFKYWWALSERAHSPKNADKLLAHELKKTRVAKLAGGSLLPALRDMMPDRGGSDDGACVADDGSQNAGAAPARSASGRVQAPPP